MKVLFGIWICGALLTQSSNAQSSAPDSSLFDFWIGEWDLWWYGKDSVKEYGTNSITRILDNRVIREDFAITSGTNTGFKGQSVSLLDVQTATWKQTWVDNTGGYMPFTGGSDGVRRYFQRESVRGGKTILQKMIFHSIAHDSLVWDWTNSTDGGRTWNTLWRIHYHRRK
jgi:hypothetical protein